MTPKSHYPKFIKKGMIARDAEEEARMRGVTIEDVIAENDAAAPVGLVRRKTPSSALAPKSGYPLWLKKGVIAHNPDEEAFLREKYNIPAPEPPEPAAPKGADPSTVEVEIPDGTYGGGATEPLAITKSDAAGEGKPQAPKGKKKSKSDAAGEGK